MFLTMEIIQEILHIDDIVEGISRVIDKSSKSNNKWDSNQPDPATSEAPWRIYNIGSNSPVKLMDYIGALEKSLNKKAKINYLPLQPGDVPDTYADVSNLVKNFDYKPKPSVAQGVSNFVNWYKTYFS